MPSISGINRDGETYGFCSLSKIVFTMWTSEKECSELLWTFDLLFGLLQVAKCAWFGLNRFCGGVNKGQLAFLNDILLKWYLSKCSVIVGTYESIV